MSEVNKTITAVTKATGSLNKVAVELQKQFQSLNGLTESVTLLAEDIEYKQQQLDAIEQTISDSQRKAKAELNLRILEDEDEVVSGILADRGTVAIDRDELTSLRNELTKAEYDNEDAVNSAVAVQVKKGQSELAAAVNAAKSAYAVESANDKARISMLETQLTDARENVAELKEMLNDERQARVDIAKAGMNINVAAPTK